MKVRCIDITGVDLIKTGDVYEAVDYGDYYMILGIGTYSKWRFTIEKGDSEMKKDNLETLIKHMNGLRLLGTTTCVDTEEHTVLKAALDAVKIPYRIEGNTIRIVETVNFEEALTAFEDGKTIQSYVTGRTYYDLFTDEPKFSLKEIRGKWDIVL